MARVVRAGRDGSRGHRDRRPVVEGPIRRLPQRHDHDHEHPHEHEGGGAASITYEPSALMFGVYGADTVAVRADTGAVVWSVGHGAGTAPRGIAAYGEAVYLFEDSRVVKHNAADGVVVWSYVPGDMANVYDGAVMPDGSVVFTLSSGSTDLRVRHVSADGVLIGTSESLLTHAANAVIDVDEHGNIAVARVKRAFLLGPDLVKIWGGTDILATGYNFRAVGMIHGNADILWAASDAGTTEGRVYQLDKATGAVLWTSDSLGARIAHQGSVNLSGAFIVADNSEWLHEFALDTTKSYHAQPMGSSGRSFKGVAYDPVGNVFMRRSATIDYARMEPERPTLTWQVVGNTGVRIALDSGTSGAGHWGPPPEFASVNHHHDGDYVAADEPATDTHVGMLVRVNRAGIVTTDRVSIGAIDSGGVGSRALVVPN